MSSDNEVSQLRSSMQFDTDTFFSRTSQWRLGGEGGISGLIPRAPPGQTKKHWGSLCTARALRATFRLFSPRRAPKHTPWKCP